MRSNLCIEPQFSQGSWCRPGIAPSDLNNFLLTSHVRKKKCFTSSLYIFLQLENGSNACTGSWVSKNAVFCPFFQNIVCRYIYGIRETLLADQIRKILLAKTGSPPDLNIQSTIGLGNLTSICRAP